LSRNSGATTSWDPKGLSRPVAGKLYLLSFTLYENIKSRTIKQAVYVTCMEKKIK
jgi:hypothetical protein